MRYSIKNYGDTDLEFSIEGEGNFFVAARTQYTTRHLNIDQTIRLETITGRIEFIGAEWVEADAPIEFKTWPNPLDFKPFDGLTDYQLNSCDAWIAQVNGYRFVVFMDKKEMRPPTLDEVLRAILVESPESRRMMRPDKTNVHALRYAGIDVVAETERLMKL